LRGLFRLPSGGRQFPRSGALGQANGDPRRIIGFSARSGRPQASTL